MSKIVSRKNIPDSGDIVDSVKYNKDRTIGAIIFDSGKIVYFSCDPVEFGKKKQAVKEGMLIQPSRSRKSSDIPYSDNSHVNPDYQNRVLQTLAQMKGVSVEEVKQEVMMNQVNHNQYIDESQINTPSDDFELKRRLALEDSEARSTQLAEQISLSSGGRLESSFRGKNSISLN
jgi:hypothetical protein